MAFGRSLRHTPPQRDVDPQTVSVPAPIGGVNARDALAAMPPTDAVSASNCFGTPSYVQFRNGCLIWATGLPSNVETIMAYNGLTTRKLFGVSGNSIYDITVTGAVGAALVTGLGNSRLQHQMFNAGGGNVLVWANGAVQPQFYNGTVWAATTISGSGLAPANLITATVFKQRMWYIENNSMNVWYAGILSFQGVLIQLPLGQIFKKGGTLMQMATWTIDNVSGIDDYAVFITSEGEVAIYQGYDPAQVSTWSLVGVFTIGRPIGRRCYTKYAADIIVITADGLTPLSKAMLTDRTQEDAQLTYKILNAINNDVQAFNANFGWQVIDYPLGNKLVLNVPDQTNTTMHQWVMNSVARSWWRFDAWNANCWELQQDALYFGASTKVFLADTGLSDANTAINIDCKPAFSYMDAPGKLKNFMMARGIFQANAIISPKITLNVDFNDIFNPSPLLVLGGIAPWDTSPWDTTGWGDATPTISNKNWQGITGLGYVASGLISQQVSGVVVQWYSTDYIFEDGGAL
jgi:hypothetical protein